VRAPEVAVESNHLDAMVGAAAASPIDSNASKRSGHILTWLATVGAGMLLLTLALLPSAPLHADDRLFDDRIKASFLYRFLDYTEWPFDLRLPQDPVTIGVLGDDDVASALERYAADVGNKGPVVDVVRMAGGEPLQALQMLYIAGSHEYRRAEVARASRQRGLLVVSDWEGALDQGAAINFVMRDGRVRFEVSLPAAARAGVRFSARMLAVAAEVRSGQQ
jgi:hypothetical protein